MANVIKRVVEETTHSFDWEGKTINFSTGKLAPQSDGSVVVKFGENVLLFTAVLNKNPDPDKDYTPLMIDFRESFASAGKIGGSAFRRREGRPATDTVLYARLTDRALRPLFPKGMTNDIVVSITPLSLDREQDLGAMSIIGSSMAVLSGGVPFNYGPVGAVRIGYIDGKYIINPNRDELEKSDLNLIVAGPKGLTNMIEVDAKEVPDEIINEAFRIGQEHIDKTINEQQSFLDKLNIQPKTIVTNKPSVDFLNKVGEFITEDKLKVMVGKDADFSGLFDKYKQEALEYFKDKIDDKEEKDFTYTGVKGAVFTIVKVYMRNRTLDIGERFDGRPLDQIRPLYSEVGVTPRTHGSGLFWRGDTQVLTTTTLGGPRDYQINDTMEFDEQIERYFHHYNFPPFSVNEARGTRGAGRRELGHGALAEKALIHVIPSKDDFPYIIRTVSECLSSGGSTSQASVCGSTLALLDAGVPIKSPVSGIANGLMTEYDDNGNIVKYKLLMDMAGIEDFMGDMDFKVAGSKNGITAIQLDTKIPGLTHQMVVEAIAMAHTGRNQILDFMLDTISEPKKELSKYAPKIHTFKIDPEKVRAVIGKGGEMINKIIEKAGGVKIDFEDDGTVVIADQDQNKINMAEKLIREIADPLPLNTPIEGEISRVENYGIFVNLPGGKSGLAHIKTLGVMGDLNKHFKIKQKIMIKIKEVDSKGRLNLMKA